MVMKLEGIYKLCTWRVRRQESVSDIHKEQQSWFPPYLGMMLHNKLINMDDFTCQPVNISKRKDCQRRVRYGETLAVSDSKRGNAVLIP